MHSVEITMAWLHPGDDSSAARLSAAERERAARFRFDADRRRYIAARAKLRELLGARCGRPPESLELQSDAHGKPFLGGSRLHFSVSRSGELAAYALADGMPVGIDVEAIRPLAGADAIAARTFSRRERAAYAALPQRARASGFFRGWTRTEALAKAIGRGLALSPAALDALEDQWVVRSFAPAPGYAGAVAFPAPS
jgi:4'-phosphopantetheinyl transferase